MARRAAKIQSRPTRRFPLVPVLIGAVALALVGTFLFQRLGDGDGDDGSNQGVSGTQLPGATGGQPAPAAAATPGASPASALASPVATSGCWNSPPVASGQGQLQWSEPPQQVIDPTKTYTATITTTAGDIVVTLDPARAPVTVNNFVCLAGAGYYDNTPLHRIIQGFMIQGGDPTGTGSGGPGYQFADELPQGATPYVRGTIAMANSGPNTNGSQFFIVHQDQPAQFPSNYSIFGQVTQGMEIVDALAASPVQDNGRGELSAPTSDVRILSVTVTAA